MPGKLILSCKGLRVLDWLPLQYGAQSVQSVHSSATARCSVRGTIGQCVNMYICKHIYIYVHTYIYIYVYIYIYPPTPPLGSSAREAPYTRGSPDDPPPPTLPFPPDQGPPLSAPKSSKTLFLSFSQPTICDRQPTKTLRACLPCPYPLLLTPPCPPDPFPTDDPSPSAPRPGTPSRPPTQKHFFVGFRTETDNL